MNPRLIEENYSGSDGVRTRDRPVKSRVLYLTKLQTQPSELAKQFNYAGWCSQINLPFGFTKVSVPEEEEMITISQIPTNKPT